MRWESGRRSDNVEDRRGLRVTRGIAGGGLGTLVPVLIGLYFGVDPSTILNTIPTGGGSRVEQSNEPRPAAENVRAARGKAGEREANRLSVCLELQADCFAGVWGNRADKARRLLDPGDLEEALRAAGAIGDDRLQRETRARVVPDSFTHGTSAQRVSWFRRGFAGGDLARCDTFAAREL